MVLPFALQMATQQWCEFHGTAKRPSCILMWTTNVILLGVKQGERVWPQVEIASLLCADWIFFFFFFFWFALYSNVMIIWTFFFPPKQARTRTHWLRWACVRCVGACELGDGFGCVCTGGLGRPRPRLRPVHTARGCVSWMTQASQDHAV